jgi:hypothetical protein
LNEWIDRKRSLVSNPAKQIKDSIDCEINLKFINTIRECIVDEVLTCDVKITPHNEDFFQYIIRRREYILLSFLNV